MGRGLFNQWALSLPFTVQDVLRNNHVLKVITATSQKSLLQSKKRIFKIFFFSGD